MLPEDKFFESKDEGKIWQRYCGFLDLSLAEFMQIQHRLLMEQIELVADSPLGKKIMKGSRPQSVEEFRRLVPLTTYEDYEPYLSQQQEDMLAEKPLFWCHSSGRGGYFKWIPYNHRAFEVFSRRILTLFILGATNSKGKVNLWPGTRILLLVPPQPYTSGSTVHYLSQRFS
ncbi:MAG: GH3 auxin-responsive promoter family protein, partial [Dehalococcoidia bacterium]|nr:GH3 auxin-responsive promoter family protein [Dehalococcoidia bacterium]